MKTIYTFLICLLLTANAFAVVHVVNVQDDKFAPAYWSINKNDVIVWRMITGPHTVISGANCHGDGAFHSEILQKGDSFVRVFKQPGAFEYFDAYNCEAGMTGVVEVSYTVSGIETTNPASASLSLYPNPFSGAFTLNYTIPQNSQVNITLTDMSGKKLYVSDKGQIAGSYSEKIVLDHIPSGFYILTLSLNGIQVEEIKVLSE